MKGFTLIELLVVSGIVVLLTALMVPSWRAGEGSLAVERTAAKIGQDIRRTTELSLHAKWFDCAAGKITGYGLYITSNSTSYTIFADCNNNQRYDSATDGLVETVNIEGPVTVSSVTNGAFGMVIVPPDPAVYLKDGSGATLTSANIVLVAKNNSSLTRTITINQKGVVSIQ
ncbi:MAG: GspH/FimT family pseudopilin [Candidatus Wildermuthbacteria bacterium]|nr:GspH/FimT family pseudopilin [Candidatus Wildermuthbacteria bacterium]